MTSAKFTTLQELAYELARELDDFNELADSVGFQLTILNSGYELVHAKKIEDYLTGWNMIPKLPVVSPSVLVFANLADIINKAYNIEYDLYCLSQYLHICISIILIYMIKL